MVLYVDPRYLHVLTHAVPTRRSSDLIGVHLWFACDDGQPVMRLPHVILMDSPLQWIFNKGMDSADRGGFDGQHLHGVISAAHDIVDRPAEEIVRSEVTRLNSSH